MNEIEKANADLYADTSDVRKRAASVAILAGMSVGGAVATMIWRAYGQGSRMTFERSVVVPSDQ